MDKLKSVIARARSHRAPSQLAQDNGHDHFSFSEGKKRLSLPGDAQPLHAGLVPAPGNIAGPLRPMSATVPQPSLAVPGKIGGGAPYDPGKGGDIKGMKQRLPNATVLDTGQQPSIFPLNSRTLEITVNDEIVPEVFSVIEREQPVQARLAEGESVTKMISTQPVLTHRSTSGKRAIQPVVSPTYEKTPELELDEEYMFPYEDANPCEVCQSLTLDGIFARKRHGNVVASFDNGGGCKHHETWGALEAAAEAGCRLCALIRDALVARTGGAELYLRTIKSSYAIFIRPVSCRSGVNRGPISVEVSTENSNLDLTHVVASCDIGLYTDRGDVAATRIPGRRLSLRPDLATICREVDKWLRAIKAPESWPDLPKRVVDVASSADHLVVNLREVYESPGYTTGQFVCLSHRWAEKSPLTTTTKTLKDRIKGIPLKNLTKTFRNAVAITRRLGLRYLWIDSLCILQDSRQDWEEESSKMGKYYGNSWLTVAAGMSEDGLFAERLMPSHPHCRLVVSSNDNSNTTASLYFSRQPHDMPIRSINTPGQSLLYGRGWTLQEEILSPRFLSFEPTQVYFRTANYVEFECGTQTTVNKWKSLGAQHLKSRDLWIRIVEDFSVRKLSVDMDKLPALSGLAHEYQMIWNDTYLASLWKKDLWKHLLWYTKEPKKPSGYRAPSWSWASVDGPIGFIGNNFSNSCIEVVRASTTPAGKDPLGHVEAGFIALRSTVIPLHLRSEQCGRDRASTVALYTSQDEMCESFDPDGDLPRGAQDVSFTYITETVGLVLYPIPDSYRIFRRIGIATAPKIPENSSKLVITIK